MMHKIIKLTRMTRTRTNYIKYNMPNEFVRKEKERVNVDRRYSRTKNRKSREQQNRKKRNNLNIRT